MIRKFRGRRKDLKKGGRDCPDDQKKKRKAAWSFHPKDYARKKRLARQGGIVRFNKIIRPSKRKKEMAAREHDLRRGRIAGSVCRVIKRALV